VFRRQQKHEKTHIDYLPVVERIRENSRDASKLTADDSVSSMVTEIDNEKNADYASGILGNSQYHDLKTVEGSDDKLYWYSETYISVDRAEQLVQLEELKAEIAEQVRECSRDQGKVTCLSTIPDDENSIDIQKIKEVVAELELDKKYADIVSVAGSSGILYLYSSDYMANNYAKTLIMAEEDDPQSMIAVTVRDESRIYPRPTNIEQFSNPIYNINKEDLYESIDGLLKRKEFDDIKLIEASTGNRYLYSSLYLDERYAKSLVEWKEVGEFENP